MTSGDFNTAIGGSAASSWLTGSKNTAIGYNSAKLTTAGENNILIGYEATGSSTTANNEITIGNSLNVNFRLPGSNFYINSGRVLIGGATDDTTSAVQVNGVLKATTVTQTSDVRAKTSIAKIQDALSKVE